MNKNHLILASMGLFANITNAFSVPIPLLITTSQRSTILKKKSRLYIFTPKQRLYGVLKYFNNVIHDMNVAKQ